MESLCGLNLVAPGKTDGFFRAMFAALFLMLSLVPAYGVCSQDNHQDSAVAHYARAIEIVETLSPDEFRTVNLYARSESVQSDPNVISLLMRVFPARNEIVKGTARAVLDPGLRQRGPVWFEYSHPGYRPLGSGSRIPILLAAHARWSAENDDPAGAMLSIASGYRYVRQLGGEGRYFEANAARNELMFWMRLVERLFESGIGTLEMARTALDEAKALNGNDPAGRIAADRPGAVNFMHGLKSAFEERGMELLNKRIASGNGRDNVDLAEFDVRSIQSALDALPKMYEEYLSIAAEIDDKLAAARADAFVGGIKESVTATLYPKLLDPLSLRAERVELVNALAEHRVYLQRIVDGEVELDTLFNGAVLYLRAGAAWRSIPEETHDALAGLDDLSDAAILAVSNEDVVKHVQTSERLLQRAAECRVLDFYAVYHGAGGDHVRPVNREILAALDAMAFAERRLLDRASRLKPDDALAAKVRGYASLIRNAEHLGHENSWVSSVLALRRCEALLSRVEQIVDEHQLDEDSRVVLMIALTEVRNADDGFGFSFSEDRDRSELEVVWSFMHGMHRDSAWRKNIREKIDAFTPWQRFVVRVLLEANRSSDPNFDLVRDLDRRLGTTLASVLDDQWGMLRIQTGRTHVEPADIDAAFGAQVPKIDLEALDARIDGLQQALAAH